MLVRSQLGPRPRPPELRAAFRSGCQRRQVWRGAGRRRDECGRVNLRAWRLGLLGLVLVDSSSSCC